MIDGFPSDQQPLVRSQLASVLIGVVSQQLVKRSDDSGQIGAFEIMISNAAIRSHIQEGKTFQINNSIQTSKRQGMMTMDMALAELHQQGLITKEEALSYAVEKDNLIKTLK